jgi:hypothetical protein
MLVYRRVTRKCKQNLLQMPSVLTPLLPHALCRLQVLSVSALRRQQVKSVRLPSLHWAQLTARGALLAAHHCRYLSVAVIALLLCCFVSAIHM